MMQSNPQLAQMAQNPAMMQQMMQNPQAQQMMRSMGMGGGAGGA